LSVPHLGRGEKSAIEVLKEIHRGRFFYQIYLQEPGVAERRGRPRRQSARCTMLLPAMRKARTRAAGFGVRSPLSLPGSRSRDNAGTARRSPSFARVVELLGVVRDVLGRQPELSHKKIEQPALFIAGTRDPVLSFVPGHSPLGLDGSLVHGPARQAA
jgi:pimeloyl-ACP methyl ester carboxylesterase